MTDERVTELLQHADETDEHGNPTRRAQVAALTRPHLAEIEKIKGKLAESSAETLKLEAEETSFAERLADESGRTTDLVHEAQDEMIRTVLSEPAGESAAEPPRDRDGRQSVREFERKLAEDHQRLDSIRTRLRDKRKEVDRTRELMTRRLNILNSLIDSVDSVSGQDNTSTAAADAQPPAARGHARRPAVSPGHPSRRPRRVRVVRRRAS
ncbi:MAG: hypothetical protein WD208_05130 [Dehalococcoidia bacterium]